MQSDQAELRRHLAAVAAAASTPRFTAKDIAVRVSRARRRRARIGAAISVTAAAAAAAVVIPLTLGGASHAGAPAAAGSFPAGGIAPGPVPSAEKGAPVLLWTVTVNGHARGALGTLMNQSANVPRFDVAPGEKLSIAVTITVPAHTEMTKLFLGITGDLVGIGPHGPIGMKPVLATATHLTPGPYKFTLHWTVPRAAGPADGYHLAMAESWPKGTENEPQAEELPMVQLADGRS
jgi:hypothetical protein